MRQTLLAIAFILITAPALANHEVTHTFQQRLPAEGVHRLVIEIPAGDVTVRNGESHFLVIKGEAKREYDGTDRMEKNQKIADDVSAEFTINHEEAIVRR